MMVGCCFREGDAGIWVGPLVLFENQGLHGRGDFGNAQWELVGIRSAVYLRSINEAHGLLPESDFRLEISIGDQLR